MSLKDKIVVGISASNPITGEYNYSNLAFPATSLEIEDAYQRARVLEDKDAMVQIINCSRLPNLCNMRIDGPLEVKELNLLAMQLNKLSEPELTALGGLLISKTLDEDIGVSIEELINMTYNLDDTIVVEGVSNLHQLGAFAIENGLSEQYGVTKEALPYVDLQMVGTMQKQLDNGQFYLSSYVVTAGYETPSIYKSPPKEQLVVKNDIAFGIKFAREPAYNDEDLSETAEWIYLPVDKKYANEFASMHGETCIENGVYYEFKSTFLSINEEVFDDMLKFDTLNEIAKRYAEMNPENRLKFKAIVEKEEPPTLEGVLEISENMHRYEFSYFATNDGEFGKEYLAYQLPANFDITLLDERTLKGFGSKVLKCLDARITNYGAVSERDRSLYSAITYSGQEESEIQGEEMGGVSM